MARTKFVHVVNRTTRALDCMWDGVPTVLTPGYVTRQEPVMDPANPEVQKLDKSKQPVFRTVAIGVDDRGAPTKDGIPTGQMVEFYEAEGFKRQHPVMGTQDPNSVDANDADYLIGVVEWDDEIGHLEQSDAVESIDTSLLADDRQKRQIVNVAGTRRAASPSAATLRKIKANKRRHFVDEKLINPVGIRIEGQIGPGDPR